MENYILEWKIVQFLTHIASFLSEWPFAFLLVIACKPWELFSGKNVYSIDQQKKKNCIKGVVISVPFYFSEVVIFQVVRTGHGTTDWFQTGKGVRQGCILSPCLFNLYAEYIMRKDRLDEAQAGIKTARRNISNLRYTDDTTLMAESQEELESLDESQRGEWKDWLKTQHSEN